MPIYKHDCDRCEFLFSTGNEDVYVHGDTTIIRESDEGPDYWSMDSEIIDKMMDSPKFVWESSKYFRLALAAKHVRVIVERDQDGR